MRRTLVSQGNVRWSQLIGVQLAAPLAAMYVEDVGCGQNAIQYPTLMFEHDFARKSTFPNRFRSLIGMLLALSAQLEAKSPSYSGKHRVGLVV